MRSPSNRAIPSRRILMFAKFMVRGAAALAASALMLLAGCSTPPAYEVSQQPAARTGTVESIQQDTGQNVPNAVGLLGGALIGGGLGSLIGGRTAKTVATIGA